MTKIIVPQHIKDRIDYLVNNEKNEFTLWGKAIQQGEDLVLVDFYIPKQKSTLATTEIDELGMAEMIIDLAKERGENLKEWCIWIHSHNTMGAFWSGTDRETIKTMGQGLGADYMGAIVFSTTGAKGVIATYKPFNIWQEVDVEVDEEAIDTESDYYADKEEIEAEIKELQAKLEEICPFKNELALLKEKNEIEPEVAKTYSKNFSNKYYNHGWGDDDYDLQFPREPKTVGTIGKTLSKKEMKKIKDGTGGGVSFTNGWQIWGAYLWEEEGGTARDYTFDDIKNLIIADAY